MGFVSLAAALFQRYLENTKKIHCLGDIRNNSTNFGARRIGDISLDAELNALSNATIRVALTSTVIALFKKWREIRIFKNTFLAAISASYIRGD